MPETTPDTWLKDYRAKEAEKAIRLAVSTSYKGGRYIYEYAGKKYDCWELSSVNEIELQELLQKAKNECTNLHTLKARKDAEFNQIKELWKNLPMPTPEPPAPNFPPMREPVQEFEKFRLEVIEAKKEVARLEQEWIGDAVAYLHEHGKVINKDFTLAEAVEAANDVAYDLEVIRRIKAHQDGTEEIDYHCSGGEYECTGWDGEDNRCCSGGCKMGWFTHDDHTFKHPSIYPSVR